MIKENISILFEKVSEACINSGRKCSDIQIIAVSKTKQVGEIEEAYEAGIRVFGENYVQEAISKIPILKSKFTDIKFHFIGHLQSNKVKLIFDYVDCIQTIDSIKIADKLNQLAALKNITLSVLLQVNTSKENNKSGILPENLEELLMNLQSYKNLSIDGLMTIGTDTDSNIIKGKEFSLLRNLLEGLRNKGYKTLSHLSMGMSNDFELAINEGATIIRVGTNIFGNRNLKGV